VTRSITGTVAAILCVAVIAIPFGCGYDKDTPVYDTTTNPHGLPAQACELLDAIEAGQLVSYDVITESFGRLYLENQELLENEHWKEIITRLGSKFHQRADELAKQGVPFFSQAAGFYILAAFSAPDDTQLARKAALFTTWKEVTERVDAGYTCSPLSKHLADRLDFVRHFLFGDSLQRAFAEQFLVHQLLDSLVALDDNDEPARLSDPDRALLAWLEVSDNDVSDLIGRFTEPSVNLIAYRVVAVAPSRSRIELYTTAESAIADQYRVQISFEKQVPDDQGQLEMEEVVKEFDFAPAIGPWKPGGVIVATTVLAHAAKLSGAQAVLVASDDESSDTHSTPIDLSLDAEMPCSH